MNQIMKEKKHDFDLIEGKVLTIAMQRTSGTRGDFGIVLPVRSCGGVGVVARCRVRPRRR